MKRLRFYLLGSVIGVVVLTVVIFMLLGPSRDLRVEDVPRTAIGSWLVEVEGELSYRVRRFDGAIEFVDPQVYARQLYDQHQARSSGTKALFRGLNISSTAQIGWVLVGLLGQLLFAGRMLVQWIASEKQRRSVVPVAFWWMALAGASLLLIYFLWRQDVVGIIGQLTGWMIYIRNLYFIYRRRFNQARSQAVPHLDLPPTKGME